MLRSEHGSGDRRICIAVCIAVEDAELCKEVHVAQPVAVEIFKLVVADVGDGEQTSDHSGGTRHG